MGRWAIFHKVRRWLSIDTQAVKSIAGSVSSSSCEPLRGTPLDSKYTVYVGPYAHGSLCVCCVAHVLWYVIRPSLSVVSGGVCGV